MAGNEKEIQEAVLIYQIRQRQIEQMKQQMGMAEKELLELEATRIAIDDVKNSKQKNSIILPLGNGVFIEGSLSKPEEIFLDAGAGVFTKDGIEGAKKHIEKRKKDVQEIMGKIENAIIEESKAVSELEEKIRKMAG